ncbi:MAG: EscU/YscU/HrcU family type III secretion system export apparatus switch protein, partial [Pseudomonadota bacterium]
EKMMQAMPLGALSIGETTRDLLGGMLAAILLAMVFVAVVDVVWTRFSWRKGMRMSLKEVKDEVKQSDGDPIVKARQQSVARDRARNRMMEAVPEATLVVANPIHVAVALRYDPLRDVAPVLVAKGQERLCWRIREIAEEAGVPVVENIPVARGLHKSVPVGALIPESFYVVVAELIKQLDTPHRN